MPMQIPQAGFDAQAPAGDLSTLWGILQSLGLDGNAIGCWDFNDPDSYGGSGQVLTDRSAAGYDFDFGADQTVEAGDPTFVSGPPAYVSFDGADQLEATGNAKPAAIDALHQTGATGTIGVLMYKVAGVTPIFDNGQLTSQTGLAYFGNSSNQQRLTITNGASIVMDVNTTAVIGAAAWHFIGVSWTAGGTGFFWKDEAYDPITGPSDTFTATYSSPSASAANSAMRCMAASSGSVPAPSGTLFGGAFILNAAISNTQMAAINSAIIANHPLGASLP